jgi:hypothetical protein
MNNLIRRIMIAGVWVFVFLGFSYQLKAEPFGCNITEKNIEFVCGGEKFVVYKKASPWRFLKIENGPDFWVTGISFDSMKGKQNNEGYVRAFCIEKAEVVLDSEQTKIVDVEVTTFRRVKKADNEFQMENHPSRFIITFQIWKDVPALSVKTKLLNKSERFYVYRINWTVHFPEAMYTTRLPDGQIITAPSPDNWSRIKTGKNLFIHQEKKEQGIGFINEKASVYMIPAPHVCLITPREEVLNGEKTSLFEMMVVPIKQGGYAQLEETAKKIEGMKLLDVKKKHEKKKEQLRLKDLPTH